MKPRFSPKPHKTAAITRKLHILKQKINTCMYNISQQLYTMTSTTDHRRMS